MVNIYIKKMTAFVANC